MSYSSLNVSGKPRTEFWNAEKTFPEARPRKSYRLPPNRTLALNWSLQWSCQHLQSRNSLKSPFDASSSFLERTGSDDFQLRVFNYNTHEKVTVFEAHPDYIRCLVVHPTLSIVLTSCDDMTNKAWDWDEQWNCVRVRSLTTSKSGLY